MLLSSEPNLVQLFQFYSKLNLVYLILCA